MGGERLNDKDDCKKKKYSLLEDFASKFPHSGGLNRGGISTGAG